MKVLISNDDGVYAPGIRALRNELKDVFRPTVVAPLEERSTTGHTLTLDSPLRVVKIDESTYGCSGYPADCVLMGLGHLYKEINQRPDVVVSGINRGANLGQDTYYSGTVAAAREASFHGVPGIAVSTAGHFQHGPEEEYHFETAAKVLRKILEAGIVSEILELQVININVPNLPYDQLKGVKFCSLGMQNYSEDIEKRFDFRNRPYYWVGGIYSGFKNIENSDCQAVSDGYVSFTPIDLLHQRSTDEKKWSTYLEKLIL